MTILKKTLLAGFAIATLATAGTTISTTQAEAGYRNHHGYYNNYYKNNYYKYGYKRHYRYYRNCHYKKVWRTDYYGYRYLKKIKVCY